MTDINLQDWQVEEIQAALEEADRGDFASEEEFTKLFERIKISL